MSARVREWSPWRALAECQVKRSKHCAVSLSDLLNCSTTFEHNGEEMGVGEGITGACTFYGVVALKRRVSNAIRREATPHTCITL